MLTTLLNGAKFCGAAAVTTVAAPQFLKTAGKLMLGLANVMERPFLKNLYENIKGPK